ncbi:RNA polymerase sigma factor [Planobispora longispora]|uniref:DNA-directed RNA polymerase sigma-70 factor n=1 Tax=Planobispora longispora TaxID=28887 RepID=A0A8J3W7D9_9ACTN|nr:sigma-70 family RNA polymerase sigma factor [Planobispora longispora]BFE83034.1 sigma-70 family RNA polymerase sigma factor [Planobispora longispora]GIH78710.1 DNA-directed RNA polymerase sigma-70 factor [Planobispora longispora]
MRLNEDPEALEAFYRRHVDAVMRFVVRRVSDPHLAADLTADVFLAAVDSAHTYRPGRGSEIAWLYGVARNVMAAQQRKAIREVRVTSRISGRRLMDDDDLGRMEERIDAERRVRGALEAMRELPEGERAVLELVAIDQLTVAEAAEALGIRQVTARVRLHRARRALGDVVSPQAVYVKGQA